MDWLICSVRQGRIILRNVRGKYFPGCRMASMLSANVPYLPDLSPIFLSSGALRWLIWLGEWANGYAVPVSPTSWRPSGAAKARGIVGESAGRDARATAG